MPSVTIPATAFNRPAAAFMRVEQQKRSRWCWAAVIHSVSSRRWGSNAPFGDQCSLADATLSSYYDVSGCCPAGAFDGNDSCNHPVPADQMVSWGGYDGPFTLAKVTASGPFAPPGEQTIRTQLMQGLPVCCSIQWPTSDWHFVALVGCDNVGIYVGDPWTGSVAGPLPLAMIYGNYGNGSSSGGTTRYVYFTQ